MPNKARLKPFAVGGSLFLLAISALILLVYGWKIAIGMLLLLIVVFGLAITGARN